MIATRTLKFLILSLGIMFYALGVIDATAVPAYPWPVTVTQPDGTTVTLQGHGDEWGNWTTTADGYTVVQDAAGYWCYATIKDNRLAATPRIARDHRTDADTQWLATIDRDLLPTNAAQQTRQLRLNARHRLEGQGNIDLENFRGLVILVNYNDRRFIESDPHQSFDDMINQEHYAGYTDESTGEWVACTGSMHDYFRDNTNGMFAPHFDVYGPVDVDYSETFINQYQHGPELFSSVMAALDDSVDFSQYDLDGDGVIDMVYFIVAGWTSNYQGNPSSLLWPHATNLSSYGYEYDGVLLGRYACSGEIQGLSPSTVREGIGTMCHEFSHVLGLPDLYDVDFAVNGQSNHPNTWNIMAGGGYLNNSRTPSGYGIYERYAMGCLIPRAINNVGLWTLRSQQTHNEGLRLNTAVDNEFFLIENRQQEHWDEYLPGHGMLVWHVDSTESDVWEHNNVNINPNHNYFELIRATNSRYDAASDPFPGSMGVDSLINNASKPNLLSWAGDFSPYSIWNIAEADGTVTFSTIADRATALVEDFELMAPTEGDFQDVSGVFTTWSATGGRIAEVADTLMGGGQRAIALKRGGVLLSGQIDGSLRKLSFQAFNPNSFACTLRVSLSDNQGTSWHTMTSSNGSSSIRINGKQAVEISYLVDNLAQSMLKIEVVSALSSNWIYLDDVTIVTGITSLPDDVNGDDQVDIADVNIVINAMLGKDSNPSADVTGDGVVDIADVNRVINAMLGK